MRIPFIRGGLAAIVVAAALVAAGAAQAQVQAQATPCTPAGSLWSQLAAHGANSDGPSFRPHVEIVLPGEAGKVGTIRSLTMISGAASKRAAIVDATGPYVDAHPGRTIPRGRFRAVLVPPGSNNDLFDAASGMETGRAGAILLVPADPAAFCAQSGAPGLVIHSGPATAGQTLQRLPSYLMKEDDLAQAMADLVALNGMKPALVGKNYSDVVRGIQSIIGADALAPVDAWVDTKATAQPPATGEKYGAAGPPIAPGGAAPGAPVPNLAMTLADLHDLHRQIGEGYRYWVEDFARRQEDFDDKLDRAIADLQGNLAPAEREKKYAAIIGYAGDMLVYVPSYLAMLEEAKAKGEFSPAAKQLLNDDYFDAVRDYNNRIGDLRADVAGDLITLDRLSAAQQLDLTKELNPPDLQTSQCLLNTIARDIPAGTIPTSFGGLGVSGRAALFYRVAPTSPTDVVPWIRVALNVTDFRRIQSQLASQYAADHSSGCATRISINKNELVASGTGILNGATTGSLKMYACATYKTPCWKGWKQYWCKHVNTVHLATFGQTMRFNVVPGRVGQAYTLKIRGAFSADESYTLDRLAALDAQLKKALTPLGLQPDHVYFSEANNDLWLVLELKGAAKDPTLMCGIHQTIQQGGAVQ